MKRHAFQLINIAGLCMIGSAAIADDRILGYQSFGDGPEKVIVLHDWMGSSENYVAVRPWLDSDAFTYVFADVRGYGESQEMTGPFNSDQIASDIFVLADNLDWNDFHLVGHSMNGLAGFKAVLTDWKGSKRIKSFVAVTPVTPDGYPATEEDAAFLKAAITDDETAAMALGALTGGKLNAAWAQRKTTRHRQTSTPAAVEAYYDMWLNEDFSGSFSAANIETPVLVIGGRQDLPGFQEEHYAQTIAKWLPNAVFTYIENAGHYPMQETPIYFATLIETHFNENQ